MNFLQLCQRTRQECGIQGDGPAAVTNQRGLHKRIVDWVRQADVEIQNMYSDWDFLWREYSATITEGGDTLTKPSDFGSWDRDSFTVDKGTADGRKLTLIDFDDWFSTSINVKTNQAPSDITIAPNKNLKLSAPADGEYEIYAMYWAGVTELTDNTDEPQFKSDFHRVIIERARMFFFADQEAWDNFKEAQGQYMYWLNQLVSYYGRNQEKIRETDPEQMVVRPV